MDDAILRFFASLPLQGPGRDDDTREMLDLVRDALPPSPAVADFGCGTGRSTLALARALPAARIRAVDAAPALVDRLRAEADRLGLAGRLRAEVGDMASPAFEPDGLDFVWSEGAAYAVGFEAALRAWRPLLRAGGRCVVSECEWLTDHPPAEVAAFWRASYPAMGGPGTNARRAEAAGYDVLARRVLSDGGWDDYYGALARALDGSAVAVDQPGFAAHIRREIEVRAAGPGSFGYAFYVLRPAGPTVVPAGRGARRRAIASPPAGG